MIKSDCSVSQKINTLKKISFTANKKVMIMFLSIRYFPKIVKTKTHSNYKRLLITDELQGCIIITDFLDTRKVEQIFDDLNQLVSHLFLSLNFLADHF